MNLYVFNRNNPLKYVDKDGRCPIPFAIALGVYFGVDTVIVTTTAYTLFAAGASWCFYKGFQYFEHRINDANIVNSLIEDKLDEGKEKKGRKKGKDNEMKGGPPRDPKTTDYLPDPAADGTPHTTLGKKDGRYEPYTQGATFDETGEFRGRTDVTDHGRSDHPKPHYHPATGPNSANSDPEPITFDF